MARSQRFSPDRLFKRRSIVDRKPCLKEDEATRILQHFQTQPLFVEFPGSADVANERDWIDKARRGPATHGWSFFR